MNIGTVELSSYTRNKLIMSSLDQFLFDLIQNFRGK